LAMRRALEGIYPPDAFEQKAEPDLFASAVEVATFKPTVSARILIDGLALRNFPYPHTSIISGDARSLCVAMASIVAKVTRDRLMNEPTRSIRATASRSTRATARRNTARPS